MLGGFLALSTIIHGRTESLTSRACALRIFPQMHTRLPIAKLAGGGIIATSGDVSEHHRNVERRRIDEKP